MRIGIVPVLDRSWGGMYQYSVSLLDALRELDVDDEVIIFAPSADMVPEDLRDGRFALAVLPEFDRLGPLRKALGRVVPAAALSRLARVVKALGGEATSRGRSGLLTRASVAHSWFEPLELDLLVFTVENDIAFQSGVPYMVSIHDIQHRLQPGFPEFADESDWERREYRMRNAIAGACVVLVDSEIGKEDVLACYGDTGIDPDAVIPLPSAPAHYLRTIPTDSERAAVLRRYGLSDGYLFYPAQFWPHKNHRRIIEALGILEGVGVRPHLVLVGSKTGRLRRRTFNEMMTAAAKCGIAERIHYLGYVSDEDVAALYAGAAALVMPSLFGTTYIPVIEAWHFDCPVITSDLRGLREQAGDAALLVDPESSMAIAEGIDRVLNDTRIREELIGAGRRQVSRYTRADYLERVNEVLTEAKRRARATTRPKG